MRASRSSTPATANHAHPTQTLTDLLTIKREKGRFDNMTIGFCGDLKFGRTVHSLIKALSRYSNIKVILIAPQEPRLPDYMLAEMAENSRLEFREVETMEEVMPELDILYMTRVQKERFLDEEEFDRVKNSFVLNPEKLKTAKEDMIILHLAAARQRDHARRGQRSPRGLLPPGRERKVRAHGADLYAAALGRREQALRTHPGLQRTVCRERIRVPEPPPHLRHGGCRPAVPSSGGRDLPLCLLRGESPVACLFTQSGNLE